MTVFTGWLAGLASPACLFGPGVKRFMSYQPKPFASTKLCPLIRPSIFPLHACRFILSSLLLSSSFPPHLSLCHSPPFISPSCLPFSASVYPLYSLQLSVCILICSFIFVVSCRRHAQHPSFHFFIFCPT